MQEAPIHLLSRSSCMTAPVQGTERWPLAAIEALFELPFSELLFQAQTVHRANFDPTDVQLSTLLSIKTGGCPEDCSYCPQAARYDTGVEASKLLDKEVVLDVAPPALRSLTINGRLSFSDDLDLELRSEWIYLAGGRLDIGSEAKPHRRISRPPPSAG